MRHKSKAIEFLRELSDYSFQRRVWLASTGPDVSSLTESVCGLFDDTGLGDLLECRQMNPVFGQQIDELLGQLSMLIKPVLRLEKQLPADVLIERDEMARVRRLALEILALIEQADTA